MVIHILLPWILASMVVGFFGRHGRFGFWGAFLLSLLFSPLVGAVAVLAIGPSGKARRAQAMLAAAPSARPAAVAAAVRRYRLRSAPQIWRNLMLTWVALIVVFAIAFLIVDGSLAEGGRLQASLRLSLDTGTFGILGSGFSNGLASTRVLMGIERLLVIVMLVVNAARLAVAGYGPVLRQMRSDAQTRDERVQELQTALRAQQAELERLRATAAKPAVTQALQS